SDRLGDLLRRASRLDDRVREPERHAARQASRGLNVVDDHVRQRHLVPVGAVDPEQARHAALDRHGRHAGDLLGDLLGDLVSRLAAGADDPRVEVELRSGFGAHLRSLTIGKGITSRSVSRSVRIITSRSTPMPPPAVGEYPYSIARAYSSSLGWGTSASSII